MAELIQKKNQLKQDMLQKIQEKNDTIRQIKQENRKQKQEIQQKDKMLQKQDKEIQKKDKEIQELKSLWDEEILNRGGTYEYMSTQQKLSDVLDDEKKLRMSTSFDHEKFEYIYEKFEKHLKKTDMPLFIGDSENGGNRCNLTKRQVLMLDLIRKRHGTTQEMLGVFFGIDQSTVCRYIQLADPILCKVLPVADNIQKTIKEKPETIPDIVPDKELIADGTHIQIQRPSDKDDRKESYSGKKKRFTANTTMITNKNGLVVYTGPAHVGSTHDKTMLKEDDPDLGVITKSMKGKIKHGEKYTLRADLGYQGIDDQYPRANIIIPEKKKKKRPLTKRQKTSNRAKSRRRIIVEHAIGRVKEFKILTRPYQGTLEDLSREIQIATGLANFHMLWDKKKRRPMLEV